MSRRSSEPRDRDSVHDGHHATPNHGRCFDCYRYTRHPELCFDCMNLLAGEGS